MKPITIRIAEQGDRFPGSYIVEQDGKTCDGLGWDEMLGQIAVLTFPVERVKRFSGSLYPMLTPEEAEAKRVRLDPAPASAPSDDVVF